MTQHRAVSRSLRALSRPLVVLVVLVLVATGCGAERTTEVRPSSEYVALGDSYTAGAGMEPVTDESCLRSSSDYPSLVDEALGIKTFADRSCAGARLVDLSAPQVHRNPRTFSVARINEPQLNALGESTKLVTIGMGLNDRSISVGLLAVCLVPGASKPSTACRQYLQQPQSSIEAQIRAVAADLTTALATIRDQAPHARVVLVGYPRVAPDQGSCPDLLPVPEEQLTRLRETFEFVNRVWRETAERAGALYVDMYTSSEGHDICSSDPWISGYRGVAGQAAGLHPFPSYARAVADEVVAVLDE